jgi:hypothetical protein
MKKSSKNNIMNGGFPPLVLKNDSKKANNKERSMATNINNNINIYQILQTKSSKNILDKKQNEIEDLEIITDL